MGQHAGRQARLEALGRHEARPARGRARGSKSDTCTVLHVPRGDLGRLVPLSLGFLLREMERIIALTRRVVVKIKCHCVFKASKSSWNIQVLDENSSAF